jgi:hypothetical protein
MTCEACGDPVEPRQPSYGRFHRSCVERLLASNERQMRTYALAEVASVSLCLPFSDS